MRRCPPEENVLTRFGWCKYYSFEDNGEVTLAGPQSSLTFYAGSVTSTIYLTINRPCLQSLLVNQLFFKLTIHRMQRPVRYATSTE